MDRTEIRTLIKEYLIDNNVGEISSQLADNLKAFLKEKYPTTRFGNSYKILG